MLPCIYGFTEHRTLSCEQLGSKERHLVTHLALLVVGWYGIGLAVYPAGLSLPDSQRVICDARQRRYCIRCRIGEPARAQVLVEEIRADKLATRFERRNKG